MKKRMIIKGHDKNPFVKFWNFDGYIFFCIFKIYYIQY